MKLLLIGKTLSFITVIFYRNIYFNFSFSLIYYAEHLLLILFCYFLTPIRSASRALWKCVFTYAIDRRIFALGIKLSKLLIQYSVILYYPLLLIALNTVLVGRINWHFTQLLIIPYSSYFPVVNTNRRLTFIGATPKLQQ